MRVGSTSITTAPLRSIIDTDKTLNRGYKLWHDYMVYEIERIFFTQSHRVTQRLFEFPCAFAIADLML